LVSRRGRGNRHGDRPWPPLPLVLELDVGMLPRSTVVRAAPLCACVLLQASHHAPPRAKAVAGALPVAVALLPTAGARGPASSDHLRSSRGHHRVRMDPLMLVTPFAAAASGPLRRRPVGPQLPCSAVGSRGPVPFPPVTLSYDKRARPDHGGPHVGFSNGRDRVHLAKIR
jgi:hypothetical protein